MTDRRPSYRSPANFVLAPQLWCRRGTYSIHSLEHRLPIRSTYSANTSRTSLLHVINIIWLNKCFQCYLHITYNYRHESSPALIHWSRKKWKNAGAPSAPIGNALNGLMVLVTKMVKICRSAENTSDHQEITYHQANLVVFSRRKNGYWILTMFHGRLCTIAAWNVLPRNGV